MHCDEVRLEFTVWIRKDAPQHLPQLLRSSIVRTEVDASLVVVVGVEIVPDDRITSYQLDDITDSRQCDSPGNNLGP